MRLQGELRKYVRDWATFPAAASAGYRHAGLRGVWTAFANRSVHRLLSFGWFIVYTQSLEQLPPSSAPPGIRIARLEPGDWPSLSAVVSPRELARLRSLVNSGRHCLLAWRGARVIGFIWMAERLGPDILLVPFSMPPDAAYLCHCYVSLEERGNGIGAALASAALRLAKDLGFRETWQMISPSNHASLRTLAKSGRGPRIVGQVRFFKLLTRARVQFTPASATSAPRV